MTRDLFRYKIDTKNSSVNLYLSSENKPISDKIITYIGFELKDEVLSGLIRKRPKIHSALANTLVLSFFPRSDIFRMMRMINLLILNVGGTKVEYEGGVTGVFALPDLQYLSNKPIQARSPRTSNVGMPISTLERRSQLTEALAVLNERAGAAEAALQSDIFMKIADQIQDVREELQRLATLPIVPNTGPVPTSSAPLVCVAKPQSNIGFQFIYSDQNKDMLTIPKMCIGIHKGNRVYEFAKYLQKKVPYLGNYICQYDAVYPVTVVTFRVDIDVMDRARLMVLAEMGRLGGEVRQTPGQVHGLIPFPSDHRPTYETSTSAYDSTISRHSAFGMTSMQHSSTTSTTTYDYHRHQRSYVGGYYNYHEDRAWKKLQEEVDKARLALKSG